MQRDILLANRIAKAVSARGGTVYYVGGYVRDELLGKPGKDIDIEVHGISPQTLEAILDDCGQRIEMGKSFGVYGIKGHTLDIAMPRKETAFGRGHRDFAVEVDPHIGTFCAAKRRDFTVGALMKNVLTGEIIDHFGGMEDLKNKVLHHVDDASFPEDPLRVLRAAQFSARFDFTVAEETVALCKTIDLSALSKERVTEELKKALLTAKHPSLFFKALRQMEQLDPWFVELKALIGVPQNPVYHAEGDVWNHTMLVLDCAAKYRAEAKHPFPFMLSALVHDLGKAVTTAAKDGVLHAYGHETKGLPLATAFLKRLTNEKGLTAYVLNMTALHMQPGVAAGRGSSVKSTNKMFDRSLCPEDLVLLSLSDQNGRLPVSANDPTPFLKERLALFRETMAAPFVAGKDLIDAGLSPDKNFTKLLDFAHKLRLAGIPKETALKQTLAYSRKGKNYDH